MNDVMVGLHLRLRDHLEEDYRTLDGHDSGAQPKALELGNL